ARGGGVAGRLEFAARWTTTRPCEGRRPVLAHFPTCRDLPAAFHSAAAAVPDFVVQVHRRADVARHHPDFLSNARWLPISGVRLHVAVLLIHLAHGPGPPDEVPERSGTDRLIARERL